MNHPYAFNDVLIEQESAIINSKSSNTKTFNDAFLKNSVEDHYFNN